MPDFDNAWKEALEALFEPFMAFFFPEAHRDIDWSRHREMLDKELLQITPESEQGRRDGMMELPAPLSVQAWKEIRDFEKERSMPFITGAQRVERSEGLAEGLAQGLEQGRQEAREGLLAGIEAVLDVKLGAPGLALLSEIREIEDPDLLRKILQAVKQAESPEALRQLWTKA